MATEHAYDKNLSPEARALHKSLWEGWGRGRQTTDWPGEHHLEAAAAAVLAATQPTKETYTREQLESEEFARTVYWSIPMQQTLGVTLGGVKGAIATALAKHFPAIDKGKGSDV